MTCLDQKKTRLKRERGRSNGYLCFIRKNYHNTELLFKHFPEFLFTYFVRITCDQENHNYLTSSKQNRKVITLPDITRR